MSPGSGADRVEPRRGSAESAALRYTAVRAATERLCASLSAEDCALQSMPDASPAKWHLAHTSWFFETFLLAGRAGYKPFHPDFRYLFNSYYNAVGAQYPRPRRGLLSRPALSEVLAYRAHVDAEMQGVLARCPEDAACASLVELGLQHEQQHQELLLTDLKHLFACNPLRPAYGGRPPSVATPAPAPPLAWRRFESGLHEIGHAGEGFAFDNEAPRHRVWLEAFELASRPVTNGEYLAFVCDGGYDRPELWLADGWAAVGAEAWSAPLYWEREGTGWQQFTLSGMRELVEDEPVCHLSFYEADAFARWAGARLPTEQEWEVAAAGVPPAGNFADSGLLQPRSAAGGAGLAQLFGDVWEWTRSAYAPYPGYRPAPGAVGEYNGKFMSGQLVLRGGSCATPAGHVRTSYRNFFPPSARWQFSGLRLARDLR